MGWHDMTLIGLPVLVIGAGIGGLAVATALARRGASVTVLEQAGTIREVGAGLQISPNGACVLAALGLGDALGQTAVPSRGVELIDGETGGRVAHLPLAGVRGGFHFVHRADLIALLHDAARDAGVDVQTGRRVAAVDVTADTATVTGADGTVHRPALVVGADGLHSVLRAALNGRVAPFFTHQVAWRAILPAEAAIEPVARVYMGAGRHLVTYPLRGGALRNIVAVEERRTWAEESWSLTDDALALRVAFGGFIPEVRAWLDRIQTPNLWGLFRHPVAQHWHRANAAILGDAAHPTLPFLAQGANLALEDAWVLAEALAAHDTLAAGLAAYQAARRDRATRVVEAANGNARNYHLRGLRRDIAHAGLRLVSRVNPNAITRRFDWLYGFDVTRG